MLYDTQSGEYVRFNMYFVIDRSNNNCLQLVLAGPSAYQYTPASLQLNIYQS